MAETARKIQRIIRFITAYAIKTYITTSPLGPDIAKATNNAKLKKAIKARGIVVIHHCFLVAHPRNIKNSMIVTPRHFSTEKVFVKHPTVDLILT